MYVDLKVLVLYLTHLPLKRKRAFIGDLAIVIGIPVLAMTLRMFSNIFFHTSWPTLLSSDYVVQGHRFNIVEEVGCYPDVYSTPLAFVLVFSWPILLGCVSFFYAGKFCHPNYLAVSKALLARTLLAFVQRRLQLSELAISMTLINVSTYLRLMLLACTEMACTIPLGIYTVYISMKGIPINPWVSWEDTHYNFSRVVSIPAVIWRADPSFRTSVELTRWLFPACALLFFLLFGFAQEARKQYRKVFLAISKSCGPRSAPPLKLSKSS
jgi:pheromone a factor receptor